MGLSREEVARALEEIKGYLIEHGGDVELVGVGNDGVVVVRLMGACKGCASAGATLKNVVEKGLKERLKGVTRVEAIL